MVDRIRASFFSSEVVREKKKIEVKPFRDPRIPGSSFSFRPFGATTNKIQAKNFNALTIKEIILHKKDPHISYDVGSSIRALSTFVEGVIASNSY